MGGENSDKSVRNFYRLRPCLRVAAPSARAEWPDHPIRWVVGFGPGGANDLIARFAAEGVSKRLGQTIIIETGRAPAR